MRGAAFLSAAELLDRLAVMLVLLVLARLLESWEFGVVAQASALVVLFQLLSEQGLGTALIRTKQLPERADSTVFWTTLGLGSVFTLVGVAGAPLIAGLLNEPMISPVVTGLSLVFVLGSLGVTPRAMLSREMRFFPIAVAQVLGVVLGGACAIGVAFAGGGVWALVAQMLVMRTCNGLTMWLLSGWRPELTFSWKVLRPLLGFGTNVTGIGLVGFGLREADRLAVGFWLPSASVGQWGLASQISGLVARMLQGIVQRVALPAFSAIQDDHERMSKGYLLAVRLTLAVTAPLSLGIAAIPHDIVRVAAGPGWESAASAARFLSIHALVISLSPYATQMLLAAGRSGIALGLAGMGAITHLGALAGVLTFGSSLGEALLWATAAAVAIRTLAYWTVPAQVLSSAFGLSLRRQFGAVAGPLGAGLFMAAGVLSVRTILPASTNAFLAVSICVPAGALLYAVSLRVFDRGLIVELLTKVIPSVPGGARVSPHLVRLFCVSERTAA